MATLRSGPTTLVSSIELLVQVLVAHETLFTRIRSMDGANSHSFPSFHRGVPHPDLLQMIHVWDHFDYTNDIQWFKSQGWPLLKVRKYWHGCSLRTAHRHHI